MLKSLLPLTLTLLFCPVAPVSASSYLSASYFPYEEIQPYQQPIITRKERIKVNECYDYLERDFTERRYCKPDQFYLYLSDGGVLSVDEVQYNRNTVGQPYTR